jgi:hypothetical protein
MLSTPSIVTLGAAVFLFVSSYLCVTIAPLQKTHALKKAIVEFRRASKAAAEKYETLAKEFPNDPIVLFNWGAALQ